MKTLKRKLKSTAGESIGEVMAAMLVIALGLTMLVQSITGAGRLTKRAEDTANLADAMPDESAPVTVTVAYGGETESYERNGAATGGLYYYD